MQARARTAPRATAWRSRRLGGRARARLAWSRVHGKRREVARERRRDRADRRRADPDPHRPDRDRAGRRDRAPPGRRRRARGRSGPGRAGAARHGPRPEQRADRRVAHDDGCRRAPHGRRRAAPGPGRGPHRSPVRGELARRRGVAWPDAGRRPVRGLPRDRVGPGALPGRRLPGLRLGGRGRVRRRRPRHRPGRCPACRGGRRRGARGQSPACLRPGGGRDAPGGRLRDDRGDAGRSTGATATTAWRRT